VAKISISMRMDGELYQKIMELCGQRKITFTDCIHELLEDSLSGKEEEPIKETEEVEIDKMGDEKQTGGIDREFFKDWIELKLAKELEPVKGKLAVIDDFCKKFPELCDLIGAQSKKLEELERQQQEQSAAGIRHKTAAEFLDCPECAPQFWKLIKKRLAEECARDPELCKKVFEMVKEKPELFPDLEVKRPKEERKGFL